MGKQKKRICSFIMAVIMILGVIPMDVFAATKEKGTVEAYNGTPVTPTQITSQNYEQFGLTSSNWSVYNGYYGIQNASELYGFAALVNGGKNKSNAVLLQDIVINETVSESGAKYSWTPIGTSTGQAFLGTFDGNGCTVSGIYINSDDSDVGFFSKQGNASIDNYKTRIENLTISNSYICGKSNVGGIVGYITGNGTTITKCRIASDVKIRATTAKAPASVAGICGGFGMQISAIAGVCSVKDCVVLGKVEATSCNNGVGAIVGKHANSNGLKLIDVSNGIYIKNNVTARGEIVNKGKGGDSETASDSGCRQLESVSDSHECISVEHKEVQANCTYQGCSNYSYCIICNKIISGQKSISKVNAEKHSWGQWTASSQTGIHVRTCVLNSSHEESGNCIGGTATCESPAICTVCSGEYEEKLGHSYEYTAKGNTITENCKRNCGHNESAELTLDSSVSLKYTGKEIKPFVVNYSENWQGGTLEISYKNHILLSTETNKASGSITKNGKTATETFAIIKGDMAGITAKGYSGTYDGAAHGINITAVPENAKISYSTEEDGAYTSTKPTYTNVGTYTVWYKVENDNYNPVIGSEKVVINPAKLTVKGVNAGKIYGEKDPELTWSIVNGTLIGKDKLEKILISREKGEAAKDYDISVKQEAGANANYDISFEPGIFTIDKKVIGICWENTTFTYDGKKKFPIATATGVEFEDEIQLTVDGGKIDAGNDYEAEVCGITGENAENYQLPGKQETTTTFTIKKADQKAPDNLVGTPEEIDEKANGKITGVDSSMEYRKDDEIQYTAIKDSENEDSVTELTDLADGIYYIRYKETTNYNVSPDAKVELHNDKKLTVSLPEVQEGYVLTVDKDKLAWMGKATLAFALADGYSKLDNFAVKVNGETVPLDENGKYTITEAQEDIHVTAEGVADITAPTGEITVGKNKWNQFFKDITFGLFFKETQSVTIKAEDVNTGSGLDKVYYHLAKVALTKEGVMALESSAWTEYEGSFTINPQEEYVIYAKAVDKAGNTVYINSEQGIVVDTIVPVISGVEDGAIYYGNTTFAVTETYIDTVTLDGKEVTLTEGTYNIEADNEEHVLFVTDQAGNKTTVKFTVKKVTTLDDKIEKITEDKVRLEDKEDIREVISKVNELVKNKKDFTEEEKEQLTKMKETAKKLLTTVAGIKKETDNTMVASQKVSMVSNKLTVSWGKANRADGYDIFIRNCDGKNFSKKPTKTIKKNSITTYTFKKIGGKKINAAKNYKVKVRAYQYKNGKKVYIGGTYLLHVAGNNSKKYTNAKKVTVSKTNVTVKTGKTVKITAKVVKANSKKKLLGHGGTIRYYSTKTKVATVDKNGHIKAIAKGKAKIYAMAENGKKAVVTITVKQ